MRTIVLVLLGCSLALAVTTVCFGMSEYSLIKPADGSGIIYTHPSWSPDGSSIAYVTGTDEQTCNPGKQATRIRLAEFKEGKWQHRLLLKHADWPIWSPDGKQIAFGRGGTCVLELSTEQIRRLSGDGKIDTVVVLYPVQWSANGRFVVSTGVHEEGLDTYLYDLSRNRQLELSPGTSWAWSEDGMSMLSAFALGEHGPYLEGFGDDMTQLVRIDLNTSKWTTVIKGYQIWSGAWPHAENYAWVQTDDPVEELTGGETLRQPSSGPGVYQLDLDTRELRKLMSASGEIFFSPNCERFAIVSFSRDGEGPHRLYAGDTKTWRFRRIAGDIFVSCTRGDDNRSLSWSPDGSRLAYVTGQGEIRIVTFDR